MKIRLSILVVLSVSLPLFIGCATPGHTGDATGTIGIVNHIYTLRELQMRPSSCLYSLLPSQIGAGKYVDINVRTDTGQRITSAYVPPSFAVQVGDEVQLSSTKCEKELIPEVTRVVKKRY